MITLLICAWLAFGYVGWMTGIRAIADDPNRSTEPAWFCIPLLLFMLAVLMLIGPLSLGVYWIVSRFGPFHVYNYVVIYV